MKKIKPKLELIQEIYRSQNNNENLKWLKRLVKSNAKLLNSYVKMRRKIKKLRAMLRKELDKNECKKELLK